MSPVEKAPIKKYFSDASLLFKLRLSLPVSIYRGIDIISIPINRISKVLNVAARQTPHKIKKSNAKYSETLDPTCSISRPLNKKNNKVQARATPINVRLKLFICSMFFTSTGKKESPVYNSMPLATRIITRPAIAQYFGAVLLSINTPPNIIIMPQIAVNIIAFISQPHRGQLFCYLN